MKVKRIVIILGIILVLLFLILVLVLTMRSKNNLENKEEAVVIEIDEKQNKKAQEAVKDGIISTLKGMSEQKRVEYYASEFIKALEARNTSYAYKMLNSDFKNNYFNNEESFEEYIKKYFPKETSVKYSNMERLGDIYVLDLEIKDILSSDPNDFSCYIVIKENDYNDFELSFSVDSAMKKYDNEEE